MWKQLVGAASIAAILASLGCQTAGPAALHGAKGRTVESSARRDYFLSRGVPTAYRDKRNPFKTTIGVMIEGARRYDLHCAMCHGTMGTGGGAVADQLDVGPADLDRSLANPNYPDSFFYWSIAEGGAPFSTEMPAFKDDLTEREIWLILSFMRTTFAERRTAQTDGVGGREELHRQ